MSHYPVVVDAVLPELERIARRIENLLPTWTGDAKARLATVVVAPEQ